MFTYLKSAPRSKYQPEKISKKIRYKIVVTFKIFKSVLFTVISVSFQNFSKFLIKRHILNYYWEKQNEKLSYKTCHQIKKTINEQIKKPTKDIKKQSNVFTKNT